MEKGWKQIAIDFKFHPIFFARENKVIFRKFKFYLKKLFQPRQKKNLKINICAVQSNLSLHREHFSTSSSHVAYFWHPAKAARSNRTSLTHVCSRRSQIGDKNQSISGKTHCSSARQTKRGCRTSRQKSLPQAWRTFWRGKFFNINHLCLVEPVRVGDAPTRQDWIVTIS